MKQLLVILALTIFSCSTTPDPVPTTTVGSWKFQTSLSAGQFNIASDNTVTGSFNINSTTYQIGYSTINSTELFIFESTIKNGIRFENVTFSPTKITAGSYFIITNGKFSLEYKETVNITR